MLGLLGLTLWINDPRDLPAQPCSAEAECDEHESTVTKPDFEAHAFSYRLKMKRLAYANIHTGMAHDMNIAVAGAMLFLNRT
jgi:hypothetical protein